MRNFYLGLQISLSLLGTLACNRKQSTSDSALQISGGRVEYADATQGESPLNYTVLIEGKEGDCTGVLIHKKVILTAAHCRVSQNDGVSKYRIDADHRDIDFKPKKIDTSTAMKDAKVVRVVSEPSFDEYLNKDAHSGNAASVDFALLLLDEELDGQPITLASAPPREGDIVTIAGFGLDDSGHLDLELRSAQVQVEYVSTSDIYPGRAAIRSIRKTGNSRKGDSGGPLIHQGRLAGILSTGTDNSNRHGSVAHHTVWINTTMQELLTGQVSSADTQRPDLDSGGSFPPTSDETAPPRNPAPDAFTPPIDVTAGYNFPTSSNSGGTYPDDRPMSTGPNRTLSETAPLNACLDLGISDALPQLYRDGANLPFFACEYPEGGAELIGCFEPFDTRSCYRTGAKLINGVLR